MWVSNKGVHSYRYELVVLFMALVLCGSSRSTSTLYPKRKDGLVLLFSIEEPV
jgi:hypothetical protein